MTKEEAIAKLKGGCYLNCEWGNWTAYQFTCSCTDEEFECCRDDFDSIEATVEHLEDFCKGRWENVY